MEDNTQKQQLESKGMSLLCPTLEGTLKRTIQMHLLFTERTAVFCKC